MQRFAWWAKLLFVLANAGIASYFANPFSGFTGFIGWLLSFGASVVISGILLSGILLLIGLLVRGIAFFIPTEAEAGKGKNKATASQPPRLTEQQQEALSVADAGRPIYIKAGPNDLGGDTIFDRRTIESLLRHGYIEGDAIGGYSITSAGRLRLSGRTA